MDIQMEIKTKKKKSVNQIAENLKQSNPMIIPRNHKWKKQFNLL